ncbi:hypothetical protein PR202_gb17043 [Eleusine coracana subsp. coracana]|uniref:Uncharacterized protein n=1 Tax=Eleusine coracana subsp. coracana TaxID=191504 RepID=A0AAV5F1Z7_ELECO|nr:hypothetical protein QOZ80_6BG0471680 [Eleusine coracana subsp. coracana]GJN28871.1 hypothetical protein PR202_gb17043 [Eleusine coracana subsp. coracana]
MGASLLQAVAELVSRLQRAAKRMAKGSPSRSSAMWKKTFSMPSSPAKARRGAEVGLWRKEILMGERCQPLDFSGVIYYDAEGRRLAHPPPPRSPMRSPLPASPRLVAVAGRY